MQELDLAHEDAKVYKLIGPTLIKQDPVEAKSNVNKRLEFINGELSRLDARLTAHQDKASKRQQQVTLPRPAQAMPARPCDDTGRMPGGTAGRFVNAAAAGNYLAIVDCLQRPVCCMIDWCASNCGRWHGTLLLVSATHMPFG